jgi:hypothetical protein
METKHPSLLKRTAGTIWRRLEKLCQCFGRQRGHDSRQNLEETPNPYRYPEFPPPEPQKLLSQALQYHRILSQREYFAPSGAEDTQLFALYRLYEHLVLNRTTGLRNELERFWFNRWPVSSIPDPKDHSEPARYAVLACIPALMVEAFNQRIKIGIPRHADAIMLDEEMEEYRHAERKYETVPIWTLSVRPIEETLKIPHEDGEVLSSFNDKRASPQLAEKNILCWQPHIHFV